MESNKHFWRGHILDSQVQYLYFSFIQGQHAQVYAKIKFDVYEATIKDVYSRILSLE